MTELRLKLHDMPKNIKNLKQKLRRKEKTIRSLKEKISELKETTRYKQIIPLKASQEKVTMGFGRLRARAKKVINLNSCSNAKPIADIENEKLQMEDEMNQSFQEAERMFQMLTDNELGADKFLAYNVIDRESESLPTPSLDTHENTDVCLQELPSPTLLTNFLEERGFQDTDMATEKSLACNAIDRASVSLRTASLGIWENPELCFQEHQAHALLTNFLEERGFQVERHFKLETAFKATITSPDAKEDSPNIGVLCEYDALPGIGHACGHNLIAIMGLSVSLGIQEVLLKSNLQGKLTVIGCPAEEGGGGKIDLINSGAFCDVDVAMMAHPSQHNVPKPVYVAMCQVSVTFQGKASHAASYPWEGINALDAAVLCYQNVSCMRQQMKPAWRVHGIITNGGEKPNIIPQTAALLYYLRAPCMGDLKELQKRLSGCFEGAAAATGCVVSYQFDSKCYDTLRSNETLAGLYVTNGESLGIEFEKDEVKLQKQGGSTDMGNVSVVVPSIHPKFSLNTEVSLHTVEFRDIAKTGESHQLTLLHAKALACAAVDIYRDPSLLVKIKEDFHSHGT